MDISDLHNFPDFADLDPDELPELNIRSEQEIKEAKIKVVSKLVNGVKNEDISENRAIILMAFTVALGWMGGDEDKNLLAEVLAED